MRLAMRRILRLATIVLRCIPAFLRSRSKQAIVERVLRQQLATFAEKGRRPRITPADRGFWVLLSRVWSGWKEVLVIVQPDTVVRWHRNGFRLYWRSISKPGPGRPPISAEVQALIRRLANENCWRARNVQAELEKLGIFVGLSTVSRTLPKRDPDRDQRQRWSTFLQNHRHEIAAMDFLVVPTRRIPAPVRLVRDWPRKSRDHPLRRHRAPELVLGHAAASRSFSRRDGSSVPHLRQRIDFLRSGR